MVGAADARSHRGDPPVFSGLFPQRWHSPVGGDENGARDTDAGWYWRRASRLWTAP